MSEVNQSALYNSEFSGPLVNNSKVDKNSPGLNPRITSEIKLTPMGPSPENVVASQVGSSSQERDQNSSSANVRAY